MAIATIPLIVCVVGALLYALPASPKVNELGRLMFFAGLFWLVYASAGRSMRLG
jgi:Na+/phosphate symporter